MNKDWARKLMNSLKTKYKQYREEEPVLAHMIVCVMKLLNSSQEMKYTEFHKYERTILLDAVRVYVKHFIRQLELVSTESSLIKKKELVDDIEESLICMLEVYKDVIDGTSGSDKQMLSGVSVNAQLSELSPKFCAFYAEILSKLVSWLPEKDEYAFILHPVIRSNTRARVLLEQRRESGKVIIIDISCSMLESVNIVPIYIVHEAFHVITRSFRNRKYRAEQLYTQILIEVQNMLLQGVDQKFHKKVKECFAEILFKDFNEVLNYIGQLPENHEELYGRELMGNIVEYFSRKLRLVQNELRGQMLDYFCRKNTNLDFWNYCEDFSKASETMEKIFFNAQYMLCGNLIGKLLEIFMFIYREAYADIGCIITLQLSPEQYEEAFKKSIPLKKYSAGYLDYVLKLRKYFVSKCIAEEMKDVLHEEWAAFYKKQRFNSEDLKTGFMWEENTEKWELTQSKKYGKVLLSAKTEEHYVAYFKKCIVGLKQWLGESAEEKNILSKIVSLEQETLFRHILSGATLNEIEGC